MRLPKTDSMRISLKNIGKKYGKSWIFKGVDLVFEPGQSYAILGNNGSGKSTLMKVLSGQTGPNVGDIEFHGVPVEEVFKKISYCAPYIDLIEELTLEELLNFVQSNKPFLPEYSVQTIIAMFGFDKYKWIKDYSSGMKQRVKLALALFANTEVCLLDEPTSNLDEKGVEWFLAVLKELPKGRMIIIASNQEREYSFCQHLIDITQFKK